MEEYKKRRNAGRKPKDNKSSFRYTVNLTPHENDRFRLMMSKAGVNNISKYIHHAIFGKELTVVKIDKASMDYYIRLTNFYHQFQAIGNNYNQTVRAVKMNFGENRARQHMAQLEKATIQLIIVSKQIIELTKEYEEKYLRY